MRIPPPPLADIFHTFKAMRPVDCGDFAMLSDERPLLVFARPDFDLIHPRLYELLKRDSDILFPPGSTIDSFSETEFPDIELSRRSICYLHWLRVVDSSAMDSSASYIAHAVLSKSKDAGVGHLFTVVYSRGIDAAGEPYLTSVDWGWDRATPELLELFSAGSTRRMVTGNALDLPVEELNAFVFPSILQPRAETSVDLPCDI